MPETTKAEACTDCRNFLANGEYPSENIPAQNAALDRAIQRRWQTIGLAEDAKGEFSWMPCDVCGSKLSGLRYPCVGIEREPESV